tara:strand:+ start:408 stop:803 length:396 start_codon:yes stop_codon:yes gene_type:complete
MITAIDHIVFTSKDVDKTIEFYTKVLGMTLESFPVANEKNKRLSLKFGNQKINIHNGSSPFLPHAKNPTSGSIDICFLSNVSLTEWSKIFASNNIIIENGPVRKTGATGPLMSLYVRDPDGNLIEVSNTHA